MGYDCELCYLQVEADVKDAMRIMYGRGQYAQLLLCLEQISHLHPTIVDVTKTWIIDTMMKVDGELRQIALRILR